MSEDMNAVRRYANGLKDTLKRTEVDNVSALSDLAVKIVRDFAQEEEVRDFVEYMIKAGIYSSWEDFLFKFLIANNQTYENNIRARNAVISGGYSLNPVVAMYKHFQDLHIMDLDFITMVNKGKYPVLPSFYAAAYEYPLIRAMVNLTEGELIDIFTQACKTKGIDPDDFLKYFGIQKDVSASTNNASTPTTSTTPAANTTQPRFTPSVSNNVGQVTPTIAALMRKYDTIISAIKFRNPGELRNGFSSIAWKDTLTLTPFRYKQLFISDPKGKRMVQSKTNVKIDAFFRCLTDPELLLVATPGYNFLTTKQILAQDLNVSDTLL